MKTIYHLVFQNDLYKTKLSSVDCVSSVQIILKPKLHIVIMQLAIWFVDSCYWKSLNGFWMILEGPLGPEYLWNKVERVASCKISTPYTRCSLESWNLWYNSQARQMLQQRERERANHLPHIQKITRKDVLQHHGSHTGSKTCCPSQIKSLKEVGFHRVSFWTSWIDLECRRLPSAWGSFETPGLDFFPSEDEDDGAASPIQIANVDS